MTLTLPYSLALHVHIHYDSPRLNQACVANVHDLNGPKELLNIHNRDIESEYTLIVCADS